MDYIVSVSKHFIDSFIPPFTPHGLLVVVVPMVVSPITGLAEGVAVDFIIPESKFAPFDIMPVVYRDD
jgi:hypothetical protein